MVRAEAEARGQELHYGTGQSAGTAQILAAPPNI
jgi:hypothetical protein